MLKLNQTEAMLNIKIIYHLFWDKRENRSLNYALQMMWIIVLYCMYWYLFYLDYGKCSTYFLFCPFPYA